MRLLSVGVRGSSLQQVMALSRLFGAHVPAWGLGGGGGGGGRRTGVGIGISSFKHADVIAFIAENMRTTTDHQPTSYALSPERETLSIAKKALNPKL